MGGKAVAVHEGDGDGTDAGVMGALQRRPRTLEVERDDDAALGADALGHLDGALVEHLRQHDVAVEEPRAVLVADARSEEHTSELPSLMRISYAVFCLKKTTKRTNAHIVSN